MTQNIKILIAVILTALVVGLGVFYWQQEKIDHLNAMFALCFGPPEISSDDEFFNEILDSVKSDVVE